MSKIFAMFVGLFIIAGCATTSPDSVSQALAPLGTVEDQVTVVENAKGLAASGTGSSLTMVLAKDKAKLRGREALNDVVMTRFDQLRTAFISESGLLEPAAANEWFAQVSDYMSGLIERSAQPVVTNEDTREGLSTCWSLFVLSPGFIVDAVNSQSAVNTQLHTLLVASGAFQALEAEAAVFESTVELQSLGTSL